MAMEAVYFKEHEGILHNSVPAAPWWTTYGTQPFLGDSLRQSNSGSFGGRSNSGEHFTASKQTAPAEQIPDKENLTQFTISPGDKDSGEVQKSQAAITIPPTDYCSRFELGFGQPMVCAKYPYADPCYGVFSPHGPQLAGRIMLPLDLGADDGPIFVNPKQYHGIIRRRKCRAKAELLNRATRARKAYMHESRHLHAMRRPRGSGGRFLNTKSMPNTKGADPNKDRGGPTALHQPTGSQSSEVLQSDSGSSKETNGGGPMSMSVAEVTSMYAREDLNRFSMTHHQIRPSIHFLPHMMDGGRRSMVIPSKWVAAAAPDGGCCNLKV